MLIVVANFCVLTIAVQATYTAAIETLEQVGKVVESLYAKTVKIA